MNEQHFAEIEKTLLYVSEARERAERARRALEKAGAEPHLIEALDEAERALKDLGTRLMQRTYFSVREEQLSL